MNKRKIEPEALKELVSGGQMLLLEEEGSTIKSVICAEIVNADEDTIWDTLTDFEHYNKFLPGVHSSKVISKGKDETVVKFEVGMKFMGIGGSVKYSTKYKMKRPMIELVEPDKGNMTGFWEIINIGIKDRYILYYKNATVDLKTLHPVLRFFLKTFPPVELAFHIAPVSMLVKAMKKKMEG